MTTQTINSSSIAGAIERQEQYVVELTDIVAAAQASLDQAEASATAVAADAALGRSRKAAADAKQTVAEGHAFLESQKRQLALASGVLDELRSRHATALDSERGSEQEQLAQRRAALEIEAAPLLDRLIALGEELEQVIGQHRRVTKLRGEHPSDEPSGLRLGELKTMQRRLDRRLAPAEVTSHIVYSPPPEPPPHMPSDPGTGAEYNPSAVRCINCGEAWPCPVGVERARAVRAQEVRWSS
jgi:hypothetical protein